MSLIRFVEKLMSFYTCSMFGIKNPFQSGNSGLPQNPFQSDNSSLGGKNTGVPSGGVTLQNSVQPVLATAEIAGGVASGNPYAVAAGVDYFANDISGATGGSGNALVDMGVNANDANNIGIGMQIGALSQGGYDMYQGWDSSTNMDGFYNQDPNGSPAAPGGYQPLTPGMEPLPPGVQPIMPSGANPGSMQALSQGPGSVTNNYYGSGGPNAAPQGYTWSQGLRDTGLGLSLATTLYGLAKTPGTAPTAPSTTTATNNANTASAAASTELAALLKDPTTFYNTPTYQAGLQAVERTDAAQGYTGSGKMMADLQNYGATSLQAYETNLASIAGTTLNAGANGTTAVDNSSSLNLQNQINALNHLSGTLMQWGGSQGQGGGGYNYSNSAGY